MLHYAPLRDAYLVAPKTCQKTEVGVFIINEVRFGKRWIVFALAKEHSGPRSEEEEARRRCRVAVGPPEDIQGPTVFLLQVSAPSFFMTELTRSAASDLS